VKEYLVETDSQAPKLIIFSWSLWTPHYQIMAIFLREIWYLHTVCTADFNSSRTFN